MERREGANEIQGTWYQIKSEDIQANYEHSLGSNKMCGFLPLKQGETIEAFSKFTFVFQIISLAVL